MPKNRELTPETFGCLLAWLSPDPDQAALKYEELRVKLTRILSHRGCQDPDAVFDETVNRVADKLGSIVDTYRGDPAHYFYGVAKHVLQEQALINQVLDPLPIHIPEPEHIDSEAETDCLEDCLEKLSAEDRRAIIRFYTGKGRVRSNDRKLLAKELGLSENALRLRVYRLRQSLNECLERCLANKF